MHAPITSKLEQVGRRVVRWRTQVVVAWSIAALLAAVLLVGLADFWLRLGRADRFLTGSLVLLLAGGAAWQVLKAHRKRYTPEGVAAMVEGKFPQLDNHLINYLQFARDAGRDPFKQAYLRHGLPACDRLDFRKLRDAAAHRRSRIALAVTFTLFLLPALFLGKAWGVAVWRAVNPFSTLQPLTLTRIVEVSPGDTTVLQGDPLALSCAVQGFPGHEVRIDLDPGDADPVTYSLGQLADHSEQSFSHRLPRVITPLRYRFRAGDALDSAWHVVNTRPPTALTDIRLTINPPGYTGLAPESRRPRLEPALIPARAGVSATVTSNTPLKSLTLAISGDDQPLPLSPSSSERTSWSGRTTISRGSSLRFEGKDIHDAAIAEDVTFALEPDRAPAIEIVSPVGRTILPPGESPRIGFRVSDDYRLREITLEKILPGTSSGRSVHKWSPDGGRHFEEAWTGDVAPRPGRELAFRVVARDNRPDNPNETVSSTIVFAVPSHAEASRHRDELESRAMAGLQQVIELQKKNLAETERQGLAVDRADDAQWMTTAGRQREIRSLTRDLLANPLKPLGRLTTKVRNLWVNEMSHAVAALESIPGASRNQKIRLAAEALELEQSILDTLTRAESAFSQSKVDRRMSGISALLEALIRGQQHVLNQSRDFAAAKAAVSEVLVDAQDALAEDLTSFTNACRDEAGSLRGNDAAFAATLDAIAQRADNLGIRQQMILAAERLDHNKPAKAVPRQEQALANLKILRAMLAKVRLDEETGTRKALLEAVAQAREELRKIKEEYQRKLLAMEEVRGSMDKNDEDFDSLEESYEELVRKTREALLDIPAGLHVFTGLNVANDIIEDVFSVFEEVEQAEGTGHEESREMLEHAYAKEDVMLEMMEEAKGRLDDMEMWLGAGPDFEKVTTEAFDREEMPDSGIATGALATEVQDLIGDLLDEDEQMEQDAQDSATTHALPDWEAGWEVKEGNIASYGAKGKSGNETPDHHEQDGRSIVGRQGMSTGETAAGSGTVSEGDKNIEERRTEDPTQSGQVDLAGDAGTKATGGGKLATGKADSKGMSGGVERMDSNEEGSWEGMAALMARQADAIYAKASLKNIRVDDLKKAAHHLRQSGDAIAKGEIQQVREHRRLAVSSLRRAQSRLEADPTGAMPMDPPAGLLDDVVESGPDHAPPQFRDQVSNYYKALNDSL